MSASEDESDDSDEVALFIARATRLLHECSRPKKKRNKFRESRYEGERWVNDLLQGNPNYFHDTFRMSKDTFNLLLRELLSHHGLHGSQRTTPKEVLASTIYILAHNQSTRMAGNRFERSNETVFRYFENGLDALSSLAHVIVKPEDSSFAQIPDLILGDRRYYPYFEDCIGAIDGTHIEATVPMNEQVAHIGRHGYTTQNVLAACDFNLCFTFVMAGFEGTAHDARLLDLALHNPDYNFPFPPPGKYYVVDSAFALQCGFLKPYADTIYHQTVFRNRGVANLSRKELFNRQHSSLRTHIECMFGIWKNKWQILKDMPPYFLEKQIKVVVATAALHNFIRRRGAEPDVDFHRAEVEGASTSNDPRDLYIHPEDDPTPGASRDEMFAVREYIADRLMDGFS